ncbi:MAG: hypothetical protein Q7U75_11280 [Desulfobacterales bacterium]|nr:hypothetical protein [Desulfobacterales bacterium]
MTITLQNLGPHLSTCGFAGAEGTAQQSPVSIPANLTLQQLIPQLLTSPANPRQKKINEKSTM